MTESPEEESAGAPTAESTDASPAVDTRPGEQGEPTAQVNASQKSDGDSLKGGGDRLPGADPRSFINNPPPKIFHVSSKVRWRVQHKASSAAEKSDAAEWVDKGRGSASDNLEAVRSTEQEHLAYRPFNPSAEHSRRHQPDRGDRFDLLRSRVEEIAARHEASTIVLLYVRHEKGSLQELIAPHLPGRVYVRGDQGGWGPLKRARFEDLLNFFVEAAPDEADDAVFIDWLPYAERGGDLDRLLDESDHERVEEFETRLKDKRFHFYLLVAIDGPVSTGSFLNSRSCYLPWTEIWLADFARSQTLQPGPLRREVGEELQRVADWRSFENDEYEKNLHIHLQELRSKRHDFDVGTAVAAIRKAIADAKNKMPDKGEECRKRLEKYLKSPAGSGNAVDPIRQVMLSVAVFAGGTRVDEYDGVCRALLPDGPTEMHRLTPARQDEIRRDWEDAERMNRPRRPLPDWRVIFNEECDASRDDLEIRVVEGQSIQLDAQWRTIDVKREIAHVYPGLINGLLSRVRDRKLLVTSSETETKLLITIICAIRDAFEEGFDDLNLACALIGVRLGASEASEIVVPVYVVEQHFPGANPDDVLRLEEISLERLRENFASGPTQDPDVAGPVAVIRRYDPSSQNVERTLAQIREELFKGTIHHLTWLIVQMRASSGVASEKSRPIVASMLDHLNQLIQLPHYVALLTLMIARDSGIDVADITRRIREILVHRPKQEAIEAVDVILERLDTALGHPAWPHVNWLRIFDPAAEHVLRDDRVRSVWVAVWDLMLSNDVRWNAVPYDRMKYQRVACLLFGNVNGSRIAQGDLDTPALLEGISETTVPLVVKGFLAQNPEKWLEALSSLDRLYYYGDEIQESLVSTVEARLKDIVWVVLTGIAGPDEKAWAKRTWSITGDLLASLSSSVGLAPVRDFSFAATRIVNASETPTSRFGRGWLLLYGLFWPALLAHWRFTAFGVERFEAGSEADQRFRSLLDQIVAAVPERVAAFRDGCEALANAADRCADKARSMDAPAIVDFYSKKGDRLIGLAKFFAQHARDLPIKEIAAPVGNT